MTEWNWPATIAKDEWDNAVSSLREAGEYAGTKNIYLAIESLNRFETFLVNKLATTNKWRNRSA